jgi:hypothetical protein
LEQLSSWYVTIFSLKKMAASFDAARVPFASSPLPLTTRERE